MKTDLFYSSSTLQPQIIGVDVFDASPALIPSSCSLPAVLSLPMVPQTQRACERPAKTGAHFLHYFVFTAQSEKKKL